MNAIGFVTWSKLVPLLPEEQLMAAALEQRGVEVVAVPWDTTPEVPAHLAALVIRTPWNYMTEPARFMKWLEKAANAGMALWNPVELIQWNIDKRYLATLSNEGVNIVPTVFVDRGSGRKLSKVASEIEAPRLIVKPVISAGAYETYSVDRTAIHEFEPKFAELLLGNGMMVQPMIDEITTEGEWSLLYFNGEYSHAVLKKPARGDFRVQEKHGGSLELKDPSPHIIAQGQRIANLIPYDWLYARVDGVIRNNKLMLMELEAFEPQLFVLDRPKLATRFADAVIKRLAAAAPAR